MIGRKRRKAKVQPLYQQVATQLRQGIESGHYPVGGPLPTEAMLCADLNISRHTARDALRLLEEAGYVSRRRGVGTYVLSNRPKRAYVQSLGSLDDLLHYAHDTRYEIEGVRRFSAAASDLALLQGKAGDRWIKLTGRRYQLLSDRPFSITVIYLPIRFESALDEIRDHRGAIYALIEERFNVPIARASQELQAVTLSAEEATLLDAKPGDAAMRAIRRYYDTDGKLVEVSWNLYLGRLFTHSSWVDRENRL
ncbi:MAG: GntR family transcriptional regulator [Alphaproteobacteria bacterium]|nr:MAG: GntR family transcriptional regulator [Alphaproteobacteria bacterium]